MSGLLEYRHEGIGFFFRASLSFCFEFLLDVGSGLLDLLLSFHREELLGLESRLHSVELGKGSPLQLGQLGLGGHSVQLLLIYCCGMLKRESVQLCQCSLVGELFLSS